MAPAKKNTKTQPGKKDETADLPAREDTEPKTVKEPEKEAEAIEAGGDAETETHKGDDSPRAEKNEGQEEEAEEVAVKDSVRKPATTSTAQESSTPQKASDKQTPRERDAVGQPQSTQFDVGDAPKIQTYDDDNPGFEVKDVPQPEYAQARTPVGRDEELVEERDEAGVERRKRERKSRAQAKAVRFVSRAVDLRVIADPEDFVRNERGQIIKSYPGYAIEFQNNTYTVAKPDEETVEYLGEKVKTVDFLRDHPGFNVDFWEVGNAPGEPKPTVDEQNARIIRALAARDAEEILEVVREERETHQRETVYNAAETALESIAGTGDSREAARVRAGTSDERAE